MKKQHYILLLLVGFLCAYKPQEPTLTVKLPAQGWETVLQVIEASNAPHAQVKAVQTELVKQLQAQIDTSKKK